MDKRRKEIFEQLKCFLPFFPNFEMDDLILLNSLSSSDLSKDTKDTRKVTPLLQQLCRYSLLCTFLEAEEYDKLSDFFGDKNIATLNCIINISELCNNYVLNLLEDNCKHPSIVNVNNLINGCSLYDDIIHIMIQITIDEDIRIEHLEYIDESVNISIEKRFQKVISDIDTWKTINPLKLLIALSEYMIAKAGIIMNLGQEEQAELYSERLRYLNFTSAFIKINEYKDSVADSEVNEMLRETEEAYHMYKCYKHYYMKNNMKEKMLLKK